jgi:hypothetical protein
LEKRGINIEENELLSTIYQKDGISMIDYSRLYNDPFLRPIFKDYFTEKVIFRDLMSSRVSFEVRKIYYSKINVF